MKWVLLLLLAGCGDDSTMNDQGMFCSKNSECGEGKYCFPSHPGCRSAPRGVDGGACGDHLASECEPIGVFDELVTCEIDGDTTRCTCIYGTCL
jgi:hypothetical protein